MNIDIGNRWVWVTGASSGLGRELAKESARRGGRILLSGRNRPALEEVARECESISRDSGRAGGHEVLAFDLLDRGARSEAVKKAQEMSGGIRLLVLNAGISQRCGFEEMRSEAFDTIMELDFEAPVDLIRLILPLWSGVAEGRKKPEPSGIVLVSSAAGLFGAPRRSAYSAAKHALSGFGDVLRGEVYDRRIAVTTVYPGYVRTDIDKSAIGGDGSPRGVEDPAISRGADPAKVAAKIVRAALRGRPSLKVAFTLEARFALFASRRLPGLYARLSSGRVRKLAKRESRR